MSNRLQTVIDLAGAEDWEHDPWGVALNLAFDICEVIDAAEGHTPARWDYHRGASPVPSLESLAFMEGEESWGASFLAQAVLDGEITTNDLIYAGDVLNRYTRLLDAAGRSY